MPDNKGKKDKTTVRPSIEDSFKELELRNIAGEDFSYLKNQNDNISFESSIGRNSKLNYIGDYGNSKYDESLTDQYFRKYIGSDNVGFQEQRAQNQSGLAKVGSGLGNTITQAGLDIFKDAGYLLDFKNYFDFKKSAEEGFHNWFSDAIQSVEDKLKLPVYRTEESKGFSPTSAGWWGDNLPSIASSIAMAFPAEAAVAGLGKLGGLIGGEKLIKGLETLSGVTGLADKAKGVGAAIISRQMESLMEGGQTYQDTFNEAMKKPGMTEEQARQIAGEAAANNYKANWAAIVQDIPEYMILHKTFKEANKLFSLEAGKEALKTAALEGSEEAYQYITDKEAKRSALINGKVLKDDNTTLADRLIDYSKDGDLWTSAFFGAIGGAGFGAAGVQNNYKNQQKFDNVLQAHQAILKGDKEGYNRAQDNILNSTIVDKVDNDIKNGSNTQLEQFKQGLEYIKSNPERIKDEDRVETITRLNEAIAQTEYAQNLQQEVMNDSSIEPELKKLTFGTKLEQRSIENRLAQVNNKLSALSSKDAVNLGFSADIQAYKAAKLKYKAISQIPALSKEAEELGKNLENVKERIASDENYNFKSFDELDKFILSSNDKELTNLYYNQAKEQANLKDVKDLLYSSSTPEGKKELKDRIIKAKQTEQDINTLSESIENATNEKDLNSLLKEADDKNISTPEIIDQIAKKRQQIINDRARQDLISKLDPVEETIIDTPTTIDESNVNTINPIEDGTKKAKYYNKTNNGQDNDSKESVSRAFRYNESLLTGKVNITDKRLKVVTKANNPELYNRILLEDPQNKQFEDNYKKKEGKDYQGLYVVVTDSNNQPVLVDNKLVFSTLETAQRVIDGSILPEDKQAAITNLNDLRSSLLVSKDPNAYLQPIATSKGIPEYLPKVGNKRQSISVTQSFGPIDQLELEVPTLQAGDKPGMAYLSKNKQIALTGKLYVYDKANTAFDLIPRNVNELEADMIINLTYQRLGLIPKTTANPVKEIEKIISALIPKGGANEFTYGFKDNNLYVGNSNVFTLQDLQEKPQEIHDFIKSFLTSTKYVNVNINKKNGYELESKFIGPTIDDKQPGKQYNKYKEYLLEGSSPMFGTDLAPSTGVQYRNVYLIYETDENGKPVIKTDNIGQTNELTDSNGNPIATVDIESILNEEPKSNKRRDYYGNNTSNSESLDRSSKIKESKPLSESEIKWFKSRFPNIPIERVQGLIENKAFGRFISSGKVLLSNLAPKNTLRHEAFHIVTQLYLTKDEIVMLYNEVKSKIGDMTDLKAEEILAEDFANYKDNHTILSNRPKRNSLFRKILDFIRALIGLPAKSIEEIYNRIDKGYYTGRKLENIKQFTSLDSLPGLTVTQTKELYDSMDAMFSDIIFKDNKTPSQALSKTDKVLEFIYKRLIAKEEQVIASNDQQLIKVYDNILSNWGDVIKGWKERMVSLGVPIEDTKESELEYNLDNEEISDEEYSEEHNVRSGDAYKEANEVSTKKTMFTSSKLLIRTLKQKNLDGSDKLNSLGLAQTVEFAPTYNYILKQTVGLSEYNDIYNKLVELSKSRPELVDLTLRLKEPSDSLPLEQIILQRQFRQDFSKNLSDIYITSIQPDGTILQVNSIKQNIQEKVRDKWKSNIKLLSKPNNEGKLIVSPKQTKDDIEFLKSIGIEFSKESLPLTKSNKEFTDAVTLIRNYIKENNGDITKLYNDDNINGRINYLTGLEAQNNTSVMELSVLSTTNKTIYPVSNNNGLSIIKNIINNSKTLQDLYKALPHLNTVSAENSVWLSKLFDSNGIEIKNKSLQLGLADGVTSEDTSNSTAKLGSTDKFIQEIDQLLKYGNSSVIRTSDKASEHIIGLGELIIPIEDLAIDPNAKDVTGFNNEKIKSIFRGYFKSELKRIASYELYDIGKNIDEYSKTGGQLTIFSSFPNISEVKEKITDTLKQIRVSVDNGMSNQQVDNLIESLYNSLVPNIENSTYEFLTKYTGELIARLTDYRAIEAISKDLKAQYPLDQLMRTVAVNDFINKVEQTKLMFGDMAFYKALFKRTSSLAGTKETAATDEELNKWLNKDNKRLDGKTANGKINVAIFEDVTQSKQGLGEYKKSLMSSGLSESEAATLLKPYTKMDEGDAQGWITLDEFREFKIRLGQWSTQLEKVWEKAQKYDKNDTSTHLTKEELNNTFFIPLKAQYAGPSINDKLFVPAFHKFSLLPLIPQLVDGKNMSDILKNMTRQKVGYALFKSGSKVGTPLVNNKANKFYTESNHGEPNLQDYNIQQIDYKFLGIQTKTSEPHDKVTFGTQLRKLLFNGAFENGEEKIPGARELFNEYTEIIKSQVQEAKDKLIKDLGLDPNNLQAKDVTKLVDLLKSESKSRNLSDNIIDSFQTITDKDGNKTLKYPLDSSVNKDKIDSLIMSLVKSRLIRQKVNGDTYIQVASTGFEELGVRGVGTNRALKFYEKTDKGTSKAEVMIPMSKNYYPLLSKYGSLEALNKAIKTKQIDEKLLTLIGYRIPTQGLNSIDHFIIKEFLPELSGSIIILPTEIVAKSGGDYDIDKMNIFRPDITKEGNLADSSHNKLINIASKMLSHPANFNALITPNSTNILTSAAEDYMYESYKAKGGNKSKDEYFKGQSKKIDYTRQLMLTENVINQHSKLMAAKGGIGPGAINNVFIPLAQSINANINNLINRGTKTERPVVINFPHNITKDGKLDIAKSMDATNTNNIQEVNSQIINAFVDAANSPELLPALNMNMDTLPIYLYLNNIGVPFEYSFWLMKQPIIQEYIKESSINDSSYLAATKAKIVASELEKRLISKYNKNITEDLPTKQYNSSEDLKRLALYNPEESKDAKLNNGYYNQQVQLFEDFLRYKQEAQMMSQAIRSINYDTNGLPSNLEQTRLKVEDYNKAKQEGFVQGLDKILNSTPIGAFDQNQFAIDAYSQFYATQSKEIRNFLDSIYNEINPKKSEDKNSILKLLTNDFINYVIQNYGYDDISTLKSRLFKGDNSIAKQIASIQADTKNPLNNNLIINELQPIIANEKTSDLKDNLRLYTKRYDSFTANQLTEAFRELKESDPNLYKDIVDLGIIQSGLANSPVTYLGLIPFEYYGDLFNQSFDEFNKKNGVTELNNFKKLFIANNSKNSLIWRTYKPNLSLGDGYYGKDYNNQSIQYSIGKTFSLQVEEFKGFWNRQQVASQQDKVFLFGDNTNDRTITKYIPSETQAVIRGLPNAIGIDTKKGRGWNPSDFFTNDDFNIFKNQVDEAIQKAKDSRKIIVIPADGIGTGKAMLKEKAPKLFEYLQQELNKLKTSPQNNTSRQIDDQLGLQFSKKNNEIIDKLKSSGYISQTHGDLFIKQHFYSQALNFINNLRKEYPNAINIERVQSKLGSKGQGIFRVKVDEQLGLQFSNNRDNSLSVESFKQIADKLSSKTGVEYIIITRDELKDLIPKKDNTSTVAGFTKNGKVYIVEDNLNSELAFHEFSHPFVDSITRDNKELFNSLKNELNSNFKSIIDEVKSNYSELLDDNGELTEEGYKEAIVTALGKLADGTLKENKTLLNLLKNLLKQISNYLVKLFSSKDNVIKPFDLDPKTTLKELSDILKTDDKIELGELDNSSTQYSLRETKQLSKPEQLLQRRIDRLTKQVTLEKDPSKKAKLQQELNYTIEEYSKAQEAEDSTPIYREFGKHTLDLAENRINFIKEGNSTDLNADLEYINDVLDVWDDFKGLRDRVAELRESIQELNNQLLVDNINESYNSKNPITLDDIKSQNKDIGTFKYWTGALLDLPNYLAHAIGFIIRTSQNNIERKTNQIYYDIDNKIKEISKSSNKSIQSIYDEIIEYNDIFDTKSLIKEDKLDSVSKEAQEFYHFYQSKIEELIEITPTLTRRNSKGELETFTLNKYFIPNVPKNSFKNTLKNFNPVKERTVGNTIKDEEQKADIINLNYIKRIPAKDKSDDLGNSLFLFAKDIYNYDEMSKILPKVRLIQREIEKTSYIQGSNPNYTKTGKDSNLYKITEAFIKAQIKGEYKEEQGRSITWGTKTDEKGNTTEKYLDITGTIDNLLKWNSLNTIGLTPIGASANIGFGKLSNFMEAIGGRFFNRTHLRQAERIFWNQTFDKNSVLNKELLSKYNILQELTDYEQSENLKTGKYKKLSSEKLIELMYAPQKYGEKWIQSSTLLAIMIHDGYLSPEGELTDKFNNASNKEKEQLFGKITGINNKLHGRYSAKEAAALQQNVIYRALTQFRKWIPAAIEARFDEKHYDPRLGVEVEGRYRTFGREVLLKLAKGDVTNAFYNLFMPLINAKEALESGKLTESDIYNMRKMLIESVLAIATLVLYSIGTGDDPEDKKRRKEAWFKSTMLLLNRISGDLTFFYSPNQINNLTKNAIPMSKLVDDLLKIGPEIPNAFDSKKNKFKSGNSKGQYKLPKRIISVIPGSKAPYDLIKIFNKQALDEVK